MRYTYVLLVTIFFSCNSNNPENAANEYCMCLQQQYNKKIDRVNAFSICDSLIKSHYSELRTYEMGKAVAPEKWNSAAKFRATFTELIFQNCCGLIGNCDVINFRKSLLEHYTSYSFRHEINAVNYIEKLYQTCSNKYIDFKYTVDFQERLVALGSNESNYSFFYYEILIFDEVGGVDSIIKLIENPCSQKALPRIKFYVKIDNKTLFVCDYQNFDFEKMRKLFQENFHGCSVNHVGDS